MSDKYLGVPCSACKLESLMPCTREDEAAAVAAGMWLCGVEDITVFMQNSGFGHCIDIITSLIIPYQIQITFKVFRGSDTPQHKIMNAIHDELIGLIIK